MATARALLESEGLTSRLETFSGNYGMFRGLAAVGVALAPVAWTTERNELVVYAVLLVSTCLAVYRMRLFGLRYATELFAVIASQQLRRAAPTR